MNQAQFTTLIQSVVQKAYDLKNKHTEEKDAPVNYAALFSQTEEEYQEFLSQAKEIGTVIKETSTGPLFKIIPIQTIAGELKLLKIRKPDQTRPERGDADFTISDYDTFKEDVLAKDGFKLIQREEFEMIELIDEDYHVRAYFSNPPMDEQLGI